MRPNHLVLPLAAVLLLTAMDCPPEVELRQQPVAHVAPPAALADHAVPLSFVYSPDCGSSCAAPSVYLAVSDGRQLRRAPTTAAPAGDRWLVTAVVPGAWVSGERLGYRLVVEQSVCDPGCSTRTVRSDWYHVHVLTRPG